MSDTNDGKHKKTGGVVDPGDITLVHYLRTIRANALPIVAGSMMCGAAAFAFTIMQPRIHEATVTLLLTPSKVDDQTSLPASVPTFLAVVANRSVASALVAEFHLDDPPHELGAVDFLERGLKVERVRDTNLLNATVRLRDADLAAEVANRLGEMAVALHEEITRADTVATRDLLKARRDETRGRLDEARAALLTFEAESQIEVLQAEVAALLEQKTDFLELEVRIAQERARLIAAESERSKRQETLTIERSIDSEALMLEATRQQLQGSSEGLLGLQLRDEVVNTVFQDLDQRVAAAQIELAALEKRRDDLVTRAQLDRRSLDKVAELQQKLSRRAELRLEQDLGRDAFENLQVRFEQAEIDVIARSGNLQVIDRALPQPRPVSRRLVPTVILGLLVGLSLTVAAVIFREYSVT